MRQLTALELELISGGNNTSTEVITIIYTPPEHDIGDDLPPPSGDDGPYGGGGGAHSGPTYSPGTINNLKGDLSMNGGVIGGSEDQFHETNIGDLPVREIDGGNMMNDTHVYEDDNGNLYFDRDNDNILDAFAQSQGNGFILEDAQGARAVNP